MKVELKVVGTDSNDERKKALALKKIAANPALTGAILDGIAKNGAELIGGDFGGMILQQLGVQ